MEVYRVVPPTNNFPPSSSYLLPPPQYSNATLSLEIPRDYYSHLYPCPSPPLPPPLMQTSTIQPVIVSTVVHHPAYVKTYLANEFLHHLPPTSPLSVASLSDPTSPIKRQQVTTTNATATTADHQLSAPPPCQIPPAHTNGQLPVRTSSNGCIHYRNEAVVPQQIQPHPVLLSSSIRPEWQVLQSQLPQCHRGWPTAVPFNIESVGTQTPQDLVIDHPVLLEGFRSIDSLLASNQQDIWCTADCSQDFHQQLRELIFWRENGWLSDDEFSLAKHKILK
jgi:hypothetical protein